MKQLKQSWAGLALACIALTATVGCASHQREQLPNEFHEWAYTQARTTDVPSAAHSALEDGQPGQRIEFGTTPWGDNTQYQITHRYFAASGRPCFRGQLSFAQQAAQADSETAIVCRYNRGRWVATRAIAEEINVVDHARPAAGAM